MLVMLGLDAIIFSYYYYVHLWETHFKDMNVTFFCDDLSVVEILKKQTSPDPALMRLLRQFVVLLCATISCLWLSILISIPPHLLPLA